MRTRNAALMVTRRCNMKCAHCSVESHPGIKIQPGDDELRDLVDQAVAAGLTIIQFTGGEPMLRQDLVLELMARAQAKGVSSSLTSNGFWGKKPEVAERLFDALREAGMIRLAISYDRFHAEFQGPGPVLNILEVAARRDFPVHINITRTADDRELDEIVAPFQALSHAQLRFYDIQPVGFAKSLGENLRAQMDGFCSACEQVTFTDNGRVVACNGPSYFEPSTSGLVLGEYRSGTTALAELVARHGSDPILETIRTEGPARLAEILGSLPGFESFPFRDDYGGMCALCTHINRDPEAVRALRDHLSQPEQAAVLLAKRLVRQRAGRGALNRDGVNERLAPIALLRLLLTIEDESSDRVLGRADLDWHRWMERLRGLGMLHLLHAHRSNPVLARWAPGFFLRAAEEATLRLEASLSGRRDDLESALAVGREAGFAVAAWGSSALLSRGGRRWPERLELVTTGDPARLGSLLLQRFGPDYPLRVRRERSSLLVESGDLPSTYASKVAQQMLIEWRERQHRDAASLIWDLHELGRIRGLPPSLVQTSFLAWAEARVLEEELSLRLFELTGTPPRGRRAALVVRALRSQLFRDPRRPSNLWLGPGLALLSWTSLRELPGAVLTALRRILAESPAGAEATTGRSWRKFLQRMRADWRELRTVEMGEKVGQGEGSPRL